MADILNIRCIGGPLDGTRIAFAGHWLQCDAMPRMSIPAFAKRPIQQTEECVKHTYRLLPFGHEGYRFDRYVHSEISDERALEIVIAEIDEATR